MQITLAGYWFIASISLYVIVYLAVRAAINNSILGQELRKKYGQDVDKLS